MWSEGNDTPSLSAVIAMVVALHQLIASFSSVIGVVMDDTPTHQPAIMESLYVSPGTKCQELAVAVLGMLRTTHQGKTHTAHVQTLSQQMAKAAKHLNHVVKTSLNSHH